MNDSVTTISLYNLSLCLLPVAVVVFILHRWSLGSGNALYGLLRMISQLMVIGYFLNFIFDSNSAAITLLVMAVMIFASSWIALRTAGKRTSALYLKALTALLIGGLTTLMLVTQGVLELNPWYHPRYFIPLAGMIFANAMNSISLAADRFEAELGRKLPYIEARNIAFRASLIPMTNALFAVGLVSIPGMMTGQILSGISPLIAARYQIMVMGMIYGSAGIASACFLALQRPAPPEPKP